eukprot:s4095_g9.t1
MSLFPDRDAALALTSIEAVRVYYGLGNDAWAAFFTQVGQPDMRIFAALPPEAVVENVMRTTLTDSSTLTPTHAVQIGLVWRLCRRISWTRGGGDYNAWVDEDPWAKSSAPAGPPPGPAPGSTLN